MAIVYAIIVSLLAAVVATLARLAAQRLGANEHLALASFGFALVLVVLLVLVYFGSLVNVS